MASEEWRKVLDGKPPTSEQVQKIHEKSDKDGSPKSQHHTLGPGPNQASPGNHTHDGGASPYLLSSVTFTGSRATFSAIELQLMNALILLGAVDSTTP